MRHHHSPGIRGQLMWFLCCICLFLLALVWFLSTQLLEPLYTKHIEKQLTGRKHHRRAGQGYCKRRSPFGMVFWPSYGQHRVF